MKIQTKILVGYGACLVALLGSAAAGWWSVNKLRSATDFLTGPAWSTADGAMETTIEVQNQLIAAERIAQGQDVKANLQQIADHRLAQAEATQRVLDAGLHEASDQLKNTLASYAAALDAMTAALQTKAKALAAYDAQAEHMVKLCETMEGIGDGAVEAIEAEPDTPWSWNGGLGQKWEAADGGMETSIGLLSQYYHLSRLLSGDEPGEAQQAIQDARAFQAEAAESMLATGVFDVPAGAFASQAGQTLATVYRQAQAGLNQHMDALIKAHVDYQSALNHYRQVANATMDHLTEVEETADAGVDGFSEDLLALEQRANLILILAITLGLIAAIASALLVLNSIRRPIASVLNQVGTIRDTGDMTLRIPCHSKDEMGKLAQGINTLLERLHAALQQVNQLSQDVSLGAEAINESGQQVAQVMRDQRNQVTDAATALQEMSSSIEHVANRASLAAEQAQQAGHNADDGGQVVKETITAMGTIRTAVGQGAQRVEGLGQLAQEIGQIVLVINDIADQTNLLALNAAIEAARAGEQGRGFAVVADEVRKLADRTTQATTQIADSIEEIQRQTQSAVDEMAQGSASVEAGVTRAADAENQLKAIVSSAQEVAGLIQHIAAATDEQTAASHDAAQRLTHVQNMAESVDDQAKQSANAATQLRQQAASLRQAVASFKV